MQVRLIAVGTREFPVGILCRDGRALRAAIHPVGSHRCGPSRNAGKDPSSTLRPDDLSTGRVLGHVAPSGRRHAFCASPRGWLAFSLAVRAGRRGAVFGPPVAWRCRRELGIRLARAVRRHHAVRLERGLLGRRCAEIRRRRQAVYWRMRLHASGGGCYGVGIVARGRRVARHVVTILLLLAHVRWRHRRLRLRMLQGWERVRLLTLRDTVGRLHRILMDRGRRMSRRSMRPLRRHRRRRRARDLRRSGVGIHGELLMRERDDDRERTILLQSVVGRAFLFCVTTTNRKEQGAGW